MKIVNWLMVFAMIGALSACGSLRDDQLTPKPIKDFKPKITLQHDFSVDDLGGYGNDDSSFSMGYSGSQFFHLTPTATRSQVVVASDRGQLTAVNARSGQVMWSHHYKMPFSSGMVYDHGVGVIGLNNGQCMAFDWKSGKVRWQTQLDSSVLAVPAFSGGALYVRTENDTIYRLARQNGQVRWQSHESPSEMVIHENSSPVVVGPYVLAGLSRGQLVVLSKKTGALLARHQLFTPHGDTPVQRMMDIVANPVVVFPMVIVASAHGGVAAYDLKAQKVVWRLSQNTMRSMAYKDDVLYLVDSESNVLAVDVRTGKILWEQNGMQYHHLTAPVLMHNSIIVADNHGAAMWLSKSDGRYLALIQPATSSVSVPPVVRNRSVYFYSLWGRLTKYTMLS